MGMNYEGLHAVTLREGKNDLGAELGLSLKELNSLWSQERGEGRGEKLTGDVDTAWRKKNG